MRGLAPPLSERKREKGRRGGGSARVLSPLLLSPPTHTQPPSYFIPSGFIHFFMFFVPGIIAPGPDWGLRAFIVLFGFVTGPFISLPMSVGKDYLFEWPATWCAYSIGQVVLVLTIEVLKKEWIGGAKKGRRATRGGGASKRR